MRKIFNFFIILFTSIFIASIYGIFHDQITFIISPEYYTRFKFEQFGINDFGISNEKIKVAIVGFLATWWVGLILGIVYASVSLFYNSKNKLMVTMQSIFLNILITSIFGCFGFIWGALFMRQENLSWHIPVGTINIQDFINVGSIHNFGYLGGLFGLIFGTYFQIKNLKTKDFTENGIIG